MTAVVTLRPNQTGRHYRLPTDTDYAAVRKAQARVAAILEEWEHGGRQGLCPIPDEPTPAGGGTGAGRAFSVQRYGMFQWGDLFAARQKVALVELGRSVLRDTHPTIREGLAIVIDRCANQLSHISRWNVPGEKIEGTFARQALPIVWDYAEVNPFSNATGSYSGALDWVVEFTQSAPRCPAGQFQLSDATDHPLPDQSATVWFTDPPYYDAVPYADLSDFFLVWLKRCLPDHPMLGDPFDPDNPLTPKEREAVQDETKRVEGRPKDRSWFEETMAKAFAEGRRVLSDDGVGAVVFAHKTTEGWEALLSGMIRGGWTITGSWPIATEMGSRLRARDSAALATSVHLICRPRPDDAPTGEWADVLRQLPLRVADWMDHLQGEGVRGADLVFACIGPALEVFSRHRAVETAEGAEVALPEYLEKVWEVVARAALEQVLGTAEAAARNGMAGALEEDARLTALFLWALQSSDESRQGDRVKPAGPRGSALSVAGGSTPRQEPDGEDEEAVAKAAAKGFPLPFDVVRRFSQPMGIDLERWTGTIIAQGKGVVRLFPVEERAKSLFGLDGYALANEWLDTGPETYAQLTLFPSLDTLPVAAPRRR